MEVDEVKKKINRIQGVFGFCYFEDITEYLFVKK